MARIISHFFLSKNKYEENNIFKNIEVSFA